MVPHLLCPSLYDQRRTKNKTVPWKRKVSNSGIIVTKRKCRLRRHCHHHLQKSDWSNVPSDLLELFLKKLPFADTLKCRAVCSRWRCVAQCLISSSLNSLPPAQLPPLLFHPCPPRFLDAATGGMNLYYQLNRASKKLLGSSMAHASGFSHGWFLFLHTRKKDHLCLFHPFLSSEATACLPPILTPKDFPPILTCKGSSFEWEFIDKVVFSADPILSNGNYGNAVIHPSYRKLLVAKSGATQFTDPDFQYVDEEEDQPTQWKDIICFQNRVYGVALTHERQHYMEAWDFSGECASPVKVLDSQPTFSSGKGPSSRSSLYLVESQGELLFVSIKRPDITKMPEILYGKRRCSIPELFVYARSPKTIPVYKMDFAEIKWVQMESLGDRVLFIMEHQNISVSSHEFPQYKMNTVYFKHHIVYHCQLRCGVGVFNVEDGTMEEIWPEGQR